MLLSGSLRRDSHPRKTPLVIFHIIGRIFKYIKVLEKKRASSAIARYFKKVGVDYYYEAC